jgi:hypothetical protein
MSIMDEGIIKYRQDFTFIPGLLEYEYASVERYRRILYGLRLIGAYDNGLGFGNISERKDYQRFHRTSKPQFVISGTQTGHLGKLTGGHYTRVVDFDIQRFVVTAQGKVRASSETVSHGSIYEMNPDIRAVIHFHHPVLWKYMSSHNYDATGRWVLYGTYEMAMAVKDCVGDGTQGIFVMKGHEEGGVAYGPSLSAALNIIAGIYKQCVDPKAVF